MTSAPKPFRGNYILGQFLPVKDANGEITSINPGDLRTAPIRCPFGYEAVNEAVAAARKSCAAWSRLSLGDRQGAVARYRDVLKKHSETVARTITEQIGTPLWETRLEIAETIRLIDFYLNLVPQNSTEHAIAEKDSLKATVRTHPRGVAVVVSPAIQPVLDSHNYLIPALLHGNAVILKSSRHAPFVGQCIAELAHEAGLPAGTWNIVHGDPEIARRLACHADVDVVFFTGSYETGLNLRKQVASDFWKTAVLEMVGKNAMVLWDDCDFERALEHALVCAFQTTGQRRTTASRILVHDKIFDRFVTEFHALAKKCTVGSGLKGDGAFLGPLMSQDAMENYVRYQAIALRDGCEEVMRGKPLEREEKGYYVSPSIHLVTNPDPKSTYQRSEIFGPNAAIYRVSDLDEAVEIVNHPATGLVGSVYSQKREIFGRFAADAKVGLLHWNIPTLTSTYELPAGGLKKSGNGRPMGRWAWQQCTYPIASWEAETVQPAPTEIPFPRRNA
jgi:succinylglutamic semialdehyde dehydrogenase